MNTEQRLTPEQMGVVEDLQIAVDRVMEACGWQMVEEVARWATWCETSAVFQQAGRLRSIPYDQYLRTPEWQRQRHVALARADYRCQGCDDTRYLEVHHRTYDHRGCEQPGDLTVLCSACHTAVHLVMDARRDKVRSSSRRVPV